MITQMISRIPVVYKYATGKKMNCLDFLRADHMRVELLFVQSKVVKDKKIKEKLIKKIVQNLNSHAQIEEEIFYPACEKISQLKPMILEAREEHHQFKILVDELDKLSIDDESLDAKLSVIIEDVMHHVRDEENDLFPKVGKAMSQNKLEKLGQQLQTRKVKEIEKAA